jgi:diacylglycerol kinase
MPFLDFRRLIKSFRYALRGFWYVVKGEQNVRIDLLAILVVAVLMVYFEVSLWQAVILVLVMSLVLTLELINTIFEKMVDVLQPRIHHYVEVIKDVMAAAVLVSSIGAIIIGILIFAPYFWTR